MRIPVLKILKICSVIPAILSPKTLAENNISPRPYRCCWSVTFGTDPDPDPWDSTSDLRIRILLYSSVWLTICQQKISFFSNYFLKVHLHQFSQINKSLSSRNQGFSYFYCLLIEGFGSIQNPNPDLGGLKTYDSTDQEVNIVSHTEDTDNISPTLKR